MPGTDINRYILNERAMEQDPEGYLRELPPWSITRGRELAAEEHIDMTDEHWDVVCFLRERFMHEGQAKSGRKVVEALEERYAGLVRLNPARKKLGLLGTPSVLLY